MRKRMKDQVVVITGASGGIGRAAAREFASQGATVVLAARRELPLQEVAAECERLGGQAITVVTDVTDERAVRELARRAIESFGRVDVWVNNAAVSLFGRFEETPYEVYRRVLETNLFGYIHGARAVLPYFREQGHGVLINNASMVAYSGQPWTSAYVTAKFAIRGLGECLRQELLDARRIHVCTLLPASIDTPLFQHAANYTGRAVQPMPPVYAPERVARAMVRLALRPRREMFVGNAGRLLAWQHALAPGLTERMVARAVDRSHFQDRPAEPTQGNLFEPVPFGTSASGGWKPARRRKALPLLAGIGLAVPAVASLLGRRSLRSLLT
jgi:NAD(P)-dependent dehydrogenase (short-subunit alcohol dehydrogenase family)